jgi:two-component system CheB/CheR fusion protein
MTDEPVRVLLVDDDEDDYLLTCQLFREAAGNGYRVEWVSDYGAAVRALGDGRYDLCLLDYHLGARNGLELLREAAGRGSHVPVILLTGVGERRLDLEAMEAGVLDFLEKGSLDAATLERTVRYALWRSRAECALRRSGEELERRVAERTAELTRANEVLRAEVEERRRAEEEAQESEERLRLAMEAGRLGLWRFNPAAGTVFFSAEAAAMMGLPTSRTRIGLDAWGQCVHPEDRDRVLALLREALAGRAAFDTEYRVVWSDGTVRWMASRGKVFRDPDSQPVRVIGVASDITNRKRVEEAVRESERNFVTLAEGVPQLVWTTRPDGTVDYFNGRWYEYTGLSADQALGHAWAQALHPHDRETAWQRWQDALRRGQPVEVEYRLRAAGGKYQWFLSRGVPLKDDHGPVEKWLGTSTNIDAQKRAEEALRQADRRKDEFLALLAHELRNPLAPITNALHLLRTGADLGEQDRHDAFDVLERQVEHLVRLVDDLLDVNRITRGKIHLQKERVDVATVVARSVEGSRPLIDARRHALEVSLPQEPLVLEADPVRLAQALWNLLNNAAKYTPEGGRIGLTVRREGGEVVFRVRDNGMGIRPDMLGKVFDLFAQAERTLDRAEGGLGIGLTLVRRLTEMHGGTVEAHSEGPGRGSEFVLRFPLPPVAAGDAVPQPDLVPPRSPVPGRRILVVDDNLDGARSLAKLLRLFGNDVRTVHDGRAALEVAAEYRPQVVFLDIGLPGMDGLEVCRHLRRQPGLGQTMVIALTGYGGDDDRRRSQEAGFHAHLVKPVDLDTLREVLSCPEFSVVE